MSNTLETFVNAVTGAKPSTWAEVAALHPVGEHGVVLFDVKTGGIDKLLANLGIKGIAGVFAGFMVKMYVSSLGEGDFVLAIMYHKGVEAFVLDGAAAPAFGDDHWPIAIKHIGNHGDLNLLAQTLMAEAQGG